MKFSKHLWIDSLIIIALSFFVFMLSPLHIYASESNASAKPEISNETLEGRVIKIVSEKKSNQKLEILITKGSLKEKKVFVDNGAIAVANQPLYHVGDRVIVNYSANKTNGSEFYITDYVRRKELFWLLLLFVIVVVAVARWHGVSSLIGMVISFFVIFKIILPQIVAGADPVFIAILGALIIAPITFYLSHGLNKKTTVAIVSTVLTLLITGFLAMLFVSLTKLSGFSTEEAGYLQAFYPGVINIKGLLLAGIIIGGLGIFDDVTVSQASIVAQLRETAKDKSLGNLYKRGMAVGYDHIGSMVNTLVLVYAGASLPLLLLFVGNPRPFSEIINYEFIAEEIVRTLVASTGLILAVPITTFIAAYVFSRKK